MPNITRAGWVMKQLLIEPFRNWNQIPDDVVVDEVDAS